MNQSIDAAMLAPAAEHDWLELSGAQRAIWLDLQLLDDPLAYQLMERARILGGLDVQLARQATSLLIARNDALRLRIDPLEPRQRLVATSEAPLALHDLSARQVSTENLEALIAGIFAQALPLGDGSLFHIDLIHVRPGEWMSLWRCHHLIADGASLSLAMRGWMALYNALLEETMVEAAPAASFVQTLAADRAYRNSPQRDADLAHWRARFESPPEPIFARLAADTIRPGPGTPVQWTLEGRDLEGWRAACARHGITEQRALLAMLALTVARRHGREDFTIGLALHGRDHASRELIGMLAGVLPVRRRITFEQTLQNAVQAIVQGLDDDFRHRRLPVDELGRAMGMTAGGRSRLFDVVMSYLSIDSIAAEARLGDAKVILEAAPRVEMSPLALYAAPHPAGPGSVERIELTLAFEATCMDRADCEYLAAALHQLMSCYAEQREPWLSDLELLAPAERELMLSHWNSRRVAVPEACLHELVSARAALQPDAVAVIDGECSLTYSQLNDQASTLAARIAHALRAAGAEPVVGVALPRSAHSIVSLLAILKAGAVYLPLDLAYPTARLQFMLDDARASLLLASPGSDLVCPRLAHDGPCAPCPASTPQQLAYVIYTSGSSGTPKPVGMSHAGAVNLAFSRLAHDPIGPGDRVLAAISVGFDVSIGQLLLPLLHGACVVVAPSLRHLDAQDFWALLSAHAVTHLNSVPSFFEAVLEAGPPYQGLKRLMLGGEPLSAALARKLRASMPSTQLLNMYGPTETCIDATSYLLPTGELPLTMPIGSPLPNYRAYVLDAQWRPAPIGVAGELCIGGASLARGYLGRPAQTAERFVADPFGPPGSRLYRTGDLARWRPDASLDFLGRNDQQVKIRGFRVEIGEIEAALRSIDRISQAAVLPSTDCGNTRLIAYLVGHACPDALITDALASTLPEHMLPSAFVWLDALPLTNNGKLDAKALPVPQTAPLAQHYVAPRSALESSLQQVWQQILKRDRVGVHDNFFALGGNSLMAIQLHAACERAAAAKMPLSAVFTHSTIDKMARLLAHADGEIANDILVPIRPEGRRTALFCIHPQGGTVHCYHDLAQRLPPDIPIYGLQALGLQAGEAPLDSVEAMASTYLARMRTLQAHGPYQIAGYSSGGLIAYDIARLLREQGETPGLLVMIDVPRPDLDQMAMPTEAEVPEDALPMFGIAPTDPQPRNLAELIAATRARGLIPADFGLADAERLMAVSLATVQAARSYRPAPSTVRTVQLRALRSDGRAPSDWGELLDGTTTTLDLDASHTELMEAPFAVRIADFLSPHLL